MCKVGVLCPVRWANSDSGRPLSWGRFVELVRLRADYIFALQAVPDTVASLIDLYHIVARIVRKSEGSVLFLLRSHALTDAPIAHAGCVDRQALWELKWPSSTSASVVHCLDHLRASTSAKPASPRYDSSPQI